MSDIHKNDAKLEQFIAERPKSDELVEKNILKAPALQAAKSELEKAKVADALQHKLQQRPDKEDLINHNILKDSNADPSLQAAQAELQRHQLEDGLDQKLAHRVDPKTLVDRHILNPEEVPQ